MTKQFTKEEADFICYQLIARKDDFEKEMKQGIKDTTRLKELAFIMGTLEKGIEFFFNYNVTCELNETKKLGEVDERTAAEWVTWAGWSGNHDRRIEGAKCSNCGHVHPTVYGSLNQLSKTCPTCGKFMKVVLEG